ncbi:GlcG/HbpS family heme-binding protein [Reichenbachiella ulvae]|uniref:Heme-binding protein n=1 Tax=Reichenbachiella ulvae TaxID=2980104 RepID=A0ABT3CQ42_9BACT|nr:heme-binding protein [Reichenbachiella ulvae]MCV9385835.1 heme-binding protein [Reichenbachiella ulvae]
MELKKGIKAINTVIHECLREKKEAVVAVVDSSGELVTFARTDHAPLSSIQLAINKAYTAARTKKTTEQLAQELSEKDPKEIRYYDDPKFVSWPGGIPVFGLNEEFEGAIGISSGNDNEDIELAKIVIESIKPLPPKESKLKLYS